MRFGGLFALAVMACYRAPEHNAACAIQCSGSGAACPGELVCEDGFCVEPGAVCKPTFAQVAAGTGFACGIDTSASLWCWGSNLHHTISESPTIAYPLARRVDTARHWQGIDAGGEHICGIADGRLYCWGKNDRGQVAGAVNGDIAAPVEIAGASEWTQVSAGARTTCAIGDRKLWCWGANESGQVGNGTRVDASAPTPIMTTLE